MKRNQISALHIAREKGQILPPKEGRFLRGGEEITRSEILLQERRGVVEGKTPDGAYVFQVSVPTRTFLTS